MSDFFAKLPEEQSELFGHDKAQEFLLDLWNRDALAGSWLFCGPKGTGKATLAYRLARFILSQPPADEGGLFGAPEKPTSLFVPETSPVFKSVALKSNPGLKVVEFALKEDEAKARQALIDEGKSLDAEVERNRKRYDEIRITDIRDAEAFLHLTAGANGWRVMIIDAADDMNTSAANALLKSLEEPPAKTVMILISHIPGKLLPTIRSRCRRLTLKPLDFSKIEDILKQNCNDVSSDEIHSVALLSGGSLGKALSLMNNGGLGMFKQMLSLFVDFPRMHTLKVYDFVEKTLKEKELLKTAQMLLAQWLTDICVSTDESAEIFAGEGAVRYRVKAAVPPLRLMDFIAEIRQLFADIDLDQKQVFVNVLLKLQREVA